MSKTAHIEFRLNSKSTTLTLDDLDISELKEYIEDLESLVFPDSVSKRSRPKISLELKSGSIRQLYKMPEEYVMDYNKALIKVQSEGSISSLGKIRREAFARLQKRAADNDYIVDMGSSLVNGSILRIDSNTSYYDRVDTFHESSFYIYGKVYQQGGKSPHINIETKEYGNLTVTATKEQIIGSKAMLYDNAGLFVKGLTNSDASIIKDLSLIDFLPYKSSVEPDEGRRLLGIAISKSNRELKDIDIDEALRNIRDSSI
jgi:hypothetical protein